MKCFFRNLKPPKFQRDHLFLNSNGVHMDYLAMLKRFITNRPKKNYQFSKIKETYGKMPWNIRKFYTSFLTRCFVSSRFLLPISGSSHAHGLYTAAHRPHPWMKTARDWDEEKFKPVLYCL